MGCASSVYAIRGKKKLPVPEVVVYVPSTRIPAQSDVQKRLRGLIPKDLVDRLSSLRNQIVLVAEDTGMLYSFMVNRRGSGEIIGSSVTVNVGFLGKCTSV